MQDNIVDQLNKYLQSNKISSGVSSNIPGPIITSYLFEPFNGICIKDIANTLPNIKALLKNPDINIYHKSGTALIALDIPNIERQMLFIKNIINNVDIKDYTLPVVLGCTQEGETFVYDLLRGPHIHVIGDKGSGKSTFLSGLIYSLSLKADNRIYKLSIIDTENDELSIWKRKFNIISKLTEISEYLNSLVNELHTRQRMTCIENLPYSIVVIDNLDRIINSAEECTEDIKQNIKNIIEHGHKAKIHLIIATLVDSCELGYIPTRLVFHSDVDMIYQGTITPKTLLLYGHALFSDAGRIPVALHTPYVDIETSELDEI